MADAPAAGSGAAERIREAGKWLVAASAAVGAALIAGSQLSDIGSLPLCGRLSLTCLRLPLAGLGGVIALVGIACIIWQAARLLVPIDVTPRDLIRGWDATAGATEDEGESPKPTRTQRKLHRQYPEMAHFRRNPEFVLNKSPEYVVSRVSDWRTRLGTAQNELEQAKLQAVHTPGPTQTVALVASTQPPAPGLWQRLAGAVGLGGAQPSAVPAVAAESVTATTVAAEAEMEEARQGYDRAVKNMTTMVTIAQHQRLFARFEGLLRWLIAAALITALGITLFAWASNPPSPSIRLSGADLSGAILSGARLDGADLSGANLTDANLAGATLDGADLTGATWGNTTCPDGTNSNAQQPATCLGHLAP